MAFIASLLPSVINLAIKHGNSPSGTQYTPSSRGQSTEYLDVLQPAQDIMFGRNQSEIYTHDLPFEEDSKYISQLQLDFNKARSDSLAMSKQQQQAKIEAEKRASMIQQQKIEAERINRQRQSQQQEIAQRAQQQAAIQQRIAQQLKSQSSIAREIQQRTLEEQKLLIQRRSAQQSSAFKNQLAQQKAIQEASMKALSAQNVQPVAQPRRVRAATRTGAGYDAETLNVLRSHFGVSLSEAKMIYKAYLT